jgi:hypothetical protein
MSLLTFETSIVEFTVERMTWTGGGDGDGDSDTDRDRDGGIHGGQYELDRD